MWRWRRTRRAFISPAMPEAASRWPVLLLIDPIGSGPTVRREPRARPMASHSIGSPTGAGAVGLEVGQVVGAHAGLGVDLFQEGCLRLGAGQGQPGGAAVAVDAAGQDHPVNAVVVGERVGQEFQRDDAASFRPHVAVALCREDAAAAGRRQHRGGRETGKTERAEQDAHAAGQRHAGLARPQRLTRLVQGRQRRGAGGIHRHARAVPVQEVGDAVGGVGRREPDHRVRVGGIGAGGLQVGVVVTGHPDEHRGVGAGSDGLVDARVVQGLDRHLQQQPVLGIHARRLTRRDPLEVAAVEPGHVLEEPARGRAALVVPASLGIDEPAGIETVRRYLAHQVASLLECLPQVLRAVDTTGQTAGEAHDRHSGPVKVRGGHGHGVLLVHKRAGGKGTLQASGGIKAGLLPPQTPRA